MIVRREITGLHQYERKSGLHILLDEVRIPPEEAVKRGPRHLSLMLTRRCNLSCPFCYMEKADSEASLDFLIAVCDAAVELQVLDITLGGGEPTLHSSFAEFISHAWEAYPFGISVTTNAVNINPLLDVAGKLSSVRISTDNKVRLLNQSLSQRITRIAEVHKVGANILYSAGTSAWTRETIKKLASLGTKNFLLIPEHHNGRYLLSEDDWRDLDLVVRELSEDYEIMVTNDAITKISSPMLSTADEFEYLFAHIDESGNVRSRSWGASIGSARSKNEIIHNLQQLNPLRRIENESMV